MKIQATLTLLLASFLTPLHAQDMETPTAEHQKLAAQVGTWDAVIEAAAPDGTMGKSTGVATMRMACGGFWLIQDFQADFGGMKFEGHGQTGYDPKQRKYVGTWIDSMTSMLMQVEGSLDKDGKVMTSTSMMPGHDGKVVKTRMVTTHKDANTMVFEMFMPGADGKEQKTMTITYTRRAAKPADKLGK